MTRIIQVDQRIDAKEGDLCVWWIRNPPSSPHFVPVASPDEAVEVLNTLSEADWADDSVKANCGGLEVFENGEWVEWYTEDGERGIDSRLSRRRQSLWEIV